MAVQMERAHYVQRVHPGDIKVDVTRNGRRWTSKPGDKDIQDLVDSMVREGRQLVPCAVSKTADGELRLEYGYRRWLAISYIIEAGLVEKDSPLSKLEVVVVNGGKPLGDQEAFLLNVAENVDREDITVADKASMAIRMRDEFGMPNKEIATALRVKEARVSQLVKLMALPVAVQRMLSGGDVAPATAYEMADMDADTLQVFVAKLKEGGTISREEVRRVKADKAMEAAEVAETAQARAQAQAPDSYPAPTTQSRGKGKDSSAAATVVVKGDKPDKPGPKPGPKARGGKIIATELYEYAEPAEGEDADAAQQILTLFITYAEGKRTAQWLNRQLKELVG